MVQMYDRLFGTFVLRCVFCFIYVSDITEMLFESGVKNHNPNPWLDWWKSISSKSQKKGHQQQNVWQRNNVWYSVGCLKRLLGNKPNYDVIFDKKNLFDKVTDR